MIHSSYIPIHPNPNSWSISMNFPFCVCLVPIKTPADSPRNHNHSKTVAIGHGLSESRNGTAMDSSVLQLKQLLYMWQMLTDDFDILWSCVISHQYHQSHLQISSQSIEELLECRRNQSRSEQKITPCASVMEAPWSFKAFSWEVSNNTRWLRDDSEALYRARFLSSIEWQIWESRSV